MCRRDFFSFKPLALQQFYNGIADYSEVSVDFLIGLTPFCRTVLRTARFCRNISGKRNVEAYYTLCIGKYIRRKEMPWADKLFKLRKHFIICSGKSHMWFPEKVRSVKLRKFFLYCFCNSVFKHHFFAFFLSCSLCWHAWHFMRSF